MTYRFPVIVFVALLLTSSVEEAAAQNKFNAVYTGVLVKVDDQKVSMKSLKDGKPFPTLPVDRDAMVYRDGKVCRLKDLKEGDQLRVTIQYEKGASRREIVKIVATKPNR